MFAKLMIIAGEASGDLHGSGLVRELKAIRPDVRIFGIGGDRMKSAGMELVHHINEMSVLGFWDVLKQFRFFKKVYHELVDLMDKERPDALVLIDYPGLNLKLARAAHERKIPVLYYIAPQVWAWGAGRVKKMAQTVDKMAVIIPFEEKMYRDAGIDAKFVGHPLLEVIAVDLNKNDFFGELHLDPSRRTIGVLPGSRTLEVKRLLPTLAETAAAIQKKYSDVQVLISETGSVNKEVYEEILSDYPSFVRTPDHTYEIMHHSDLLLVASGTATLESALFETPLIVVYKVDPLSYLLGKALVKIDAIGLVNVIAEKKIAPEFIQNNFTKEKLLPVAEKLLFDEKNRETMILELRKIREKLGSQGASKRTAEMALSLVAKHPKAEIANDQ
ncbi:lipid-A-disaccharide synthase [candidate division KSB1 bacterium 4484_87]|nr:MAG: lipid-A-disaccharide synthase [candidate division KSB1 bacterium 4484_87]